MTVDEPGIEIAPLSFLLGTWRGWGVFSGGGLDHQVLIGDLLITHDGGPYLIATSTTFAASSPQGVLDGEAGAREGRNALSAGGVWGTETMYLRLAPESVGQPAPNQIEGMLADPAGFTAALAGQVRPGAAGLVATAFASSASAPEVTELERRYLITGEELYVSTSMAAFGGDLAPYYTMKFARYDGEESHD